MQRLKAAEEVYIGKLNFFCSTIFSYQAWVRRCSSGKLTVEHEKLTLTVLSIISLHCEKNVATI